MTLHTTRPRAASSSKLLLSSLHIASLVNLPLQLRSPQTPLASSSPSHRRGRDPRGAHTYSWSAGEGFICTFLALRYAATMPSTGASDQAHVVGLSNGSLLLHRTMELVVARALAEAACPPHRELTTKCGLALRAHARRLAAIRQQSNPSQSF